jgi:hypothetical protein
LAESVHIEILRRGARAWNAWRDENPSQDPILDHAALGLAERQFAPINGGPINLRSASMRGAHLRFASLSKAYLEAADLSEADLAYARLDGANLTGANLSYAVLDHADFNGAVLSSANLTGANLLHVQNLTQVQINNSMCDTSTIFPAQLVHPIASLKVVRRAYARWGDQSHVSALATNSRD